jgi:hypothetical protein
VPPLNAFRLIPTITRLKIRANTTLIKVHLRNATVASGF